MSRKISIVLLVFFLIGCAKVNLQTSKPIKVDINMRVDVYQHVARDVEDIQDQIYGKSEKQMNALFFLENAYAQDNPQLNSAIEARKERLGKISDYFSKGYIGEDRNGLLEIVAQGLSSQLRAEIEALLREENNDRDIIYQATAAKNGADISEVRKMFFDNDYKRASPGSWFEIYSEKDNGYIWLKK